MTRTITVSLRAMLGVAIMACAMLAMRGIAFAQDGTAFDVKAASGADGRAGEYPFSFTINYDNGTSQDISVGGDGTFPYFAPTATGSPISIGWGGQLFPFGPCQTGWHGCFPPNPNGGCWCLCLQWCRVWRWWWIPRFFWYYNPCC